MTQRKEKAVEDEMIQRMSALQNIMNLKKRLAEDFDADKEL